MSLTTDPNGALSFDLDSFPVASSARGLQRASLGLFLALYAVLLILAILRTTHSLGRRAVYLCFVLLALCRIPTLALGLAVLQRQAAPLVMAMDIFSSLGYTFFTAGVFSLCYTWSIRLPSCSYIVQAPHPPVAIYLVPAVFSFFSIAGSAVRLVASSNGDATLYSRGRVVALIGAVPTLALSAALFLILPFAALTRPRGTPDVDHAAVAHLVRTQSLSARTSARAALAVLALSGLLVPGAVWRMVLVQTSSRTMTHPGWVRSPAGSSVLSLLPEVLALVLVVAADFERIEGGEVGVYAWRTTRARQATLYKSDSWSTATSGPSEKASEAGASETSEASTAATVTDV